MPLALIAAVAPLLAVSSGPADAARHGLRVVTQFQPPAPGQIDVIAVVFSGRFTGKTPPQDPITKVTLPGASRPHNYGLLYGTQLTKVAGHVATYVWLTMALKPLGTSASHDQPLVGESLNLTSIASGSGLHNTPEALDINTATEPERVQFEAVLGKDGILQVHVIDPKAVATYNDFNWDLNPIPSSASSVWNSVGSLVENPQQNVATVVQSIDSILHASFLSGSTPTGTGSTSLPTLTGSLFTGSSPGTVHYALNPDVKVNAYTLTDAAGAPISSSAAPSGWTCTNSTTSTFLCKGPLINPGFTGTLNYSGTAVPSISVKVSTDGAVSFGPSATLTSQSPSTSGSLGVSCPTSVTQGQSIQITITVGAPSAPEKVTWTLPDGSTVVHTAIPNTTNPTTEHDAIGTSQAGTWRVLVSGVGGSATCPAITVNGG